MQWIPLTTEAQLEEIVQVVELSAEELAATVPAAVLSRLGLTADNLLSEMPPVAELAEGLDCLIS